MKPCRNQSRTQAEYMIMKGWRCCGYKGNNEDGCGVVRCGGWEVRKKERKRGRRTKMMEDYMRGPEEKKKRW